MLCVNQGSDLRVLPFRLIFWLHKGTGGDGLNDGRVPGGVAVMGAADVSSCISILTGTLPPSSGRASIACGAPVPAPAFLTEVTCPGAAETAAGLRFRAEGGGGGVSWLLSQGEGGREARVPGQAPDSRSKAPVTSG
jgi:hypothetical protein